jgi:hypothetical protein
MTVQVLQANVLTDGSGDFTITLPCGGGEVMQVRYVVDGSSPLATGADLTITETTTGVNVLTMANIGVSSFTRSPREFVANPADGVVSSTNVDRIAVHRSLTFTIAQGGAAAVGTFYVYIQE